MKGMFRAAAVLLLVAACGRDAGITEPTQPKTLNSPLATPAATPGGWNALGVDPTTGASIETNKDDYTPGEVVHVVGHGWSAGETVDLHMTEDPDTHADVDTNVVADASGGFSIHYYDVQTHDLGVTFTLTATGSSSHSVAVATFTDGNFEMRSASVPAGVPSFQGTLIKFPQSATCDPASSGQTTLITPNVTTSAGPSAGVNDPGQSARMTVPAAVPGYVFSTWSVSGGAVTLVGSALTDVSICVAGTTNGTAGARTFTANYVANGAPVVDAGTYTVAEGTALTLIPTVTDPENDPLTYKWTVNTTGIDAGGVCTFDNNTLKNAKVTCTDDSQGAPGGKFTLTLEVKDGLLGGNTVTDNADLEVTNVAPTAAISAPSPVLQGSNFTVQLTGGTDVGTNDIPALQYAFDCGDGGGYNAFGATASRSCTAGAPPTQTVKGKIRDQDGGENEYTANVGINANNAAPTVDAGGPYSGAEGAAISLGGVGGATATDPDAGDVLTYKWTVNTTGIDAGGTCSFSPSNTVLNPSVTCTDDSNGAAGSKFTLTLEVKDGAGGHTVTDNADLTVTNALPEVQANGGSGNEGAAINISASFTDAGSNDTHPTKVWSYTLGAGVDAGTTCSFGSTSALTTTITCTDDGTINIKYSVTDDDGDTGEGTSTVTVNNSAPDVQATGGSGNEGSAINISATFTDAGSNDSHPTKVWTYTAGAGVDAGATCSFGSTSAQNTTITCTDDGSYTIKYSVTDDDGGTGFGTATVTVANAAPDVQATGGSGAEGSAVNISGSFTDAGSNDTHTKVWSYVAGAGVDAGATCSFGNAAMLATTVTCTDDGTYTLTLTVTDDDGGIGSANATLTVSNVAPTVTITSPTVGQLFNLLNGAITGITATYTDPGSNDTHQCQLILDGDIDTNGSYFPVSGGNCTGSIVPVQADVYDLIVNVKDDDGAVGTAKVMIVVYDPSAGFVTGGGWIDSPAGAYVPNAGLSGKATFGFVSKYLKGATIPTGNTEFQFHAAGMNFSSTSYQFLLVNQNGTNAQFQGKGTINGAGSYTFVLWATDAGNSGDTFRLKITDDNNGGQLVYDNLTDQVISSGSIIVHAPKK